MGVNTSTHVTPRGVGGLFSEGCALGRSTWNNVRMIDTIKPYRGVGTVLAERGCIQELVGSSQAHCSLGMILARD